MEWTFRGYFMNREMRVPVFINEPLDSSEPADDGESHPSVLNEIPEKTPKTTSTPQQQKRVYEIDGRNFSTLEEFYETISNVLIPGANWGHNLDAFNDILRGGFGTPEEGFNIIWRNSQISRQLLGYDETLRQLRIRLQKCHPTNVELVREQIAMAEKRLGETVFDWLVDIIQVHCEGGAEDDGVALILD